MSGKLQKIVDVICPSCKKVRQIQLARLRLGKFIGLCRECVHIGIGKGNHNGKWKGGKSLSKGYIAILNPDHPLARRGGYVLEHRYVAAKEWGIDAVKDMIVHHKNGDKSDNRIENL